MCCFLIVLATLGPRVAGVIWWIAQPVRWQAAFESWPIVGWIWPVLGLIFLPWTTLMFVIVWSPVSGMSLWGWLFLALALFGDIASYGGGYRGRDQIPTGSSSA